MKLGGFEKTSFVDFPGKISAVVFTQGCNFNCYYCHNKELIGFECGENEVSTDEVFEWVQEKKEFIDAITITGGEPTLQKGLKEFLKRAKSMNLLTKLDTNGSNPEAISDLLKEDLLDYIAMDLKAPVNKYESICTKKIDCKKIRKSVDIIKESGLPYEFRTTFCDMLNIEDLKTIREEFGVFSNHVIQKCRQTNKDSNYVNGSKDMKEELKRLSFKTRGY